MTWTTINPEDESTWPPADTLVLVRLSDDHTRIGLRSMDRREEPLAFYDEGEDYDDGTLGWDIASGDSCAEWHPIP